MDVITNGLPPAPPAPTLAPGRVALAAVVRRPASPSRYAQQDHHAATAEHARPPAPAHADACRARRSRTVPGRSRPAGRVARTPDGLRDRVLGSG